jgi:hypothetical protein
MLRRAIPYGTDDKPNSEHNQKDWECSNPEVEARNDIISEDQTTDGDNEQSTRQPFRPS